MAEQEKGLNFAYSPESRLTLNGKDCELWIQHTEKFIRDNEMDLTEALGMMLNYVATQAALHDHEDGSLDFIHVCSDLMGQLYRNARHAAAQGEVETLGTISGKLN